MTDDPEYAALYRKEHSWLLAAEKELSELRAELSTPEAIRVEFRLQLMAENARLRAALERIAGQTYSFDNADAAQVDLAGVIEGIRAHARESLAPKEER